MGQSVAERVMTVDEALKWIASVFNEPADRITEETDRDDIAEWDSIGVLTLMAEVDEKFNVLLTESELQSMSKVGDILDLLRKNRKL